MIMTLNKPLYIESLQRHSPAPEERQRAQSDSVVLSKTRLVTTSDRIPVARILGELHAVPKDLKSLLFPTAAPQFAPRIDVQPDKPPKPASRTPGGWPGLRAQLPTVPQWR